MRRIVKHIGLFWVMAVVVVSMVIKPLCVEAKTTLPKPLSAWNMTEGSGEEAIDKGKLKNDAYFGENTGWMSDYEGKFPSVISPGIVVADNSKGQYNMNKDFTFAAWVYVSEMSLGSWSFLADNYSDEEMTEASYSPATWTILINTKGNVCVESQGSWGQINQICTKYDMTSDGEKWRHVAVTFDKETLTFTIYIDGTDMSPYTYINNKVTNPTVVKKAIAKPTAKHRLRLLARDPQTHKLKGRMAMVRIYDKTLSQDQVKLLRKLTNGAANDLESDTSDKKVETKPSTDKSNTDKKKEDTKDTPKKEQKVETVVDEQKVENVVDEQKAESNVDEQQEGETIETTGDEVTNTISEQTDDNLPFSEGVLIAIIVAAGVLVIGIVVAIILLLRKPKKVDIPNKES